MYGEKDYKQLYEMQLKTIEIYSKRYKEQVKLIRDLNKEIARLNGIIRYKKY